MPRYPRPRSYDPRFNEPLGDSALDEHLPPLESPLDAGASPGLGLEAESPLPPPPPLPREQPARSYPVGHFAHQKLDAFAIAREALVRGDGIGRAVAPGHEVLIEALQRLLLGAYLGVADAASRWGADRISSLSAARSQAAQAAATLEAVAELELAAQAEVTEVVSLLSRLCAMLVRLGDRAAQPR